MLHTYSIVFQPAPEIVAQIKGFKDSLADNIGWYHSKNSLAHITIAEFSASEEQVVIMQKQLQRIADSVTGFTVILDHFNSYPNGAFFIAPDLASKEKLVSVMKRFHKETRFALKHKSVAPHLSIARKLSDESLIVAAALFPSVAIEFECNRIVLRHLDLTTKQFVMLDQFPFNGNTREQFTQTSLF